jgi:hypothetical protein
LDFLKEVAMAWRIPQGSAWAMESSTVQAMESATLYVFGVSVKRRDSAKTSLFSSA